MGSKTATAIVAAKQEIRLQEWAAQIEAQQASGMTVQQWCAENGINVKTYYHRLRRVREQCMETAPSIVSVPLPQQDREIHIEKNGIQITLPADIPSETLVALVQALC